MKKLMTIAVLVAGFGLFANAQEKAPKSPELKAARQTKVLTQQLTLNNKQITAVNQVLLERDKSLDSLKALKSTNDKKEQRYAHKLIHDKADKKLKAILTPEQQTKFDALAAAKKEKKAAKKAAGSTPSPKN